MNSRNQAIDAFRGIAIIAVMVFHYLVRWAPPFSEVDLYGYAHKYPSWLEFGRYGVHLFFVISGLVISMTILKSSTALDFAVRRFSRLYPALIVAGLMTLVAGTFGPQEFKRDLLDYVASLLMFPERVGATWVDGAYWSLQVEIKFYIATAICSFFLKERFWLGLAAIGVAGLVIKLAGLASATIMSFWPFFLVGVAAWYFLVEKRSLPTIILGVVSAIMLALNGPGLAETAFVLLASFVMFLMMKLDVSIAILPYLGRISYSLYLIHQIIGVILISHLKRFGLGDIESVVIVTAIMIATASLMHKYIELPGQRLILGWWKTKILAG